MLGRLGPSIPVLTWVRASAMWAGGGAAMVGEGRAWWVWREGWQRQAGGLHEALVRPAAVLVSPIGSSGNRNQH